MIKALAERPVKDGFDRSGAAQGGRCGERQVPAIWRGKLGKGIGSSAPTATIPAVSIMIALPGGHPGRRRGAGGWRVFTAAMLGPGDDAPLEAELSDELQKLGASISVSSAQYNNLITISSLADKAARKPWRWCGKCSQPGLREAD